MVKYRNSLLGNIKYFYHYWICFPFEPEFNFSLCLYYLIKNSFGLQWIFQYNYIHTIVSVITEIKVSCAISNCIEVIFKTLMQESQLRWCFRHEWCRLKNGSPHLILCNYYGASNGGFDFQQVSMAIWWTIN